MRLQPTSSAPWWHRQFSDTFTNSSFGLDRATILLSAHRSELVSEPSQVTGVLRSLDALAERVTEPTITAWHRLLWIDLGLSGNGIDYHDVRNSFLPDVLERGVGIPISLAVIGMEVGRRLSLPVFGVGMPGHFLLGYGDPTSPAELLYVDPFNSGTILDVAGAENRFASMFGLEQPFDMGYLEPTAPDAMLIRMSREPQAELCASQRHRRVTRHCAPSFMPSRHLYDRGSGVGPATSSQRPAHRCAGRLRSIGATPSIGGEPH